MIVGVLTLPGNVSLITRIDKRGFGWVCESQRSCLEWHNNPRRHHQGRARFRYDHLSRGERWKWSCIRTISQHCCCGFSVRRCRWKIYCFFNSSWARVFPGSVLPVEPTFCWEGRAEFCKVQGSICVFIRERQKLYIKYKRSEQGEQYSLKDRCSRLLGTYNECLCLWIDVNY